MAYIDTNRSAAFAQALGFTQQTSGIFAKIKAALENAQHRQKLQHMPPYLLRDIGMSDGDIAYLKSHDRFGVETKPHQPNMR